MSKLFAFPSRAIFQGKLNERVYGFLLIALGGYGVAAQATPWGMAKDADIKTVDGVVSICIPATEKSDIAIVSLWVTENELNNGARHTQWDVEMKPGGPFLSLPPGGCLKYGAELAGYQVNIPARKLEADVTYNIRLNRLVRNPRRTDVLFYTAVFCPAMRDGQLAYFQYRYDENDRSVKPNCARD
ncbi:hypothetical protein [Pseudomonas delhiensis]|uniref:hypothetical protein n=1 Tax=Pseudomonas delhiensis TaxID=366289 RepID=UPI00315AD501